MSNTVNYLFSVAHQFELCQFCHYVNWKFNRIILLDTYLLFLFIEIIDDNSNKQVKREEGSEDDEEYKVLVGVGLPQEERHDGRRVQYGGHDKDGDAPHLAQK